jgi:hypothetical protein
MEVSMTYSDEFEIIQAGDGRWDVQRRESLLVAGQVWRTASGYLLWDWADRQLGTFRSLADALTALGDIEFRNRYA